MKRSSNLENSMKNSILDIKMDKRFFSTASLNDLNDDKQYWFARDPIERLRHIERLRRLNYGSGATAGLQRVLEYTDK